MLIRFASVATLSVYAKPLPSIYPPVLLSIFSPSLSHSATPALPPLQGKLDAEVSLALMRQLGNAEPSGNAAKPSVFRQYVSTSPHGAHSPQAAVAGLQFSLGASRGLSRPSSSLALEHAADGSHPEGDVSLRPPSFQSSPTRRRSVDSTAVPLVRAAAAPLDRDTAFSSKGGLLGAILTAGLLPPPPPPPAGASFSPGRSGYPGCQPSRYCSATSAASLAAQAPPVHGGAFSSAAPSPWASFLNSPAKSPVEIDAETEEPWEASSSANCSLSGGAGLGEGEGSTVAHVAEERNAHRLVGDKKRVLDGAAAAIWEFKCLESALRTILRRPSKGLPSLLAAAEACERRVVAEAGQRLSDIPGRGGGGGRGSVGIA